MNSSNASGEAEAGVVADDVSAEGADYLDCAVGGACAGVVKAVALDAAVAHVCEVEAGEAAAAHVRELVVEGCEARAFESHARLTGARDAVVAYGHVLHRDAEGVDAVAEDVCDRALIAAAVDCVALDEDGADVRRA